MKPSIPLLQALCSRRRQRILVVAVLLMLPLMVSAQGAALHKMSPLVRSAAIEQRAQRRMQVSRRHERQLCAFVRINDDGSEVLRANGCRQLARFGNVFIASIPLNRLSSLSLDRRVSRIEAGARCSAQMDSVVKCVNVLPAWRGEGLPQAYTGKGVVMGVQDVGFDLTHPTFYDPSATDYRISRFWDQLSADTVGSSLFVGAEYVGADAILKYGCSRDGLILTHGTHTAGIAAGSGYDSPYRGMAFESDICLVSNAVTSDTAFIADADLYKYTSATDALGFKYIFDYAQSQGKPCVVSFSEGAHQDFYGDDALLYEVLDSLTGPGRILVASAGNEGHDNVHYCKPEGKALGGVFVYNSTSRAYLTLKATRHFLFRITFYHPDGPQKMLVFSKTVINQPDSLYADTLTIGNDRYPVLIAGYPNIYNPEEMAFEMLLGVPSGSFGNNKMRVSVEALGSDSEVDFFSTSCAFIESKENQQLRGYDSRYSIHTPGSAPSVICVGATSWRVKYKNYKGEERQFDFGTGGQRAAYSSIGPTYDGRTKPDVMAPGTNVVSAYSSYFLENNPNSYDINQDVAHFNFRGRTYAWNSNLGTSMATPVVSGAIALWLQANPQLSPTDIMDIFARTCRHYDSTLNYPNNLYGYGEIDVYAGLLDVLGIATSIPQLPHRQPSSVSFCMTEAGELQLRFAYPLHRQARLILWTSSGQQLLSVDCERGSEECRVSLAHLPAGVYVCQLQSDESGVAGSTLVRR